ncbi:MAG: putative motility protein [Fibrobacteres bacterium]|nr:putative motility protein [Fibrobacterota bacterium]
MDNISPAGGAQGAAASQDLIMLKKTQDLAKQQSAQLLEALPPPPQSPSPAGVGGNLDITA